MRATRMWGVERDPRASLGRREAHEDALVGVFRAVLVAAVGVAARQPGGTMSHVARRTEHKVGRLLRPVASARTATGTQLSHRTLTHTTIKAAIGPARWIDRQEPAKAGTLKSDDEVKLQATNHTTSTFRRAGTPRSTATRDDTVITKLPSLQPLGTRSTYPPGTTRPKQWACTASGAPE